MSKKWFIALEVEEMLGYVFGVGILSFVLPATVFRVIVLLCGGYCLFFLGKSFTYNREKTAVVREYYKHNKSKVFEKVKK